ncbi:MAG: hypothetical protein ACLPJH_06950 [Myxococcaceae bacterium]
MLRIITTFFLLSIVGIALSGVAAFGAAAPGPARPVRWLSVDSVASLGCAADAVGQSRLALGPAGGTSRMELAMLGCDGQERQLGMDIFVVRLNGGFELTVRDHDSGETVVRRLRSAKPADFLLSGVQLRFTLAEQTEPAS